MRYAQLLTVLIASLAMISCSDDGGTTGSTDSGSSSSGADGAAATDTGASSGGDAGASSSGADAGASSSGADTGASSSGADAGASSSGADTGASSSGADAAGGSDFYKLDFKGKQEFMKKHMLPMITKVLQDVDAKKYAEVKCTVCHGPNGFNNKWKMPQADGPPPLNPAAMPKFGKSTLIDAMYNKVTPQAIALLGAQPYDPDTGKGFGCFGCHTVEK